MPTYHRHFILPREWYESSDPDEESRYAPKYVRGNDDLGPYSSGGPLTRAQLEDAGFDHLLAHNDAEKWYVVKSGGEGDDAWQELNEIHAMNHDTETLADHGQDVEPVMDDLFGEGEWSINTRELRDSENTA